MQTHDMVLIQQSLHNAQADVTASCERILQLEASLNDFLTWAGALAISGIPSPESWTQLSRIATKADQALKGKPRP